MISRLHSLDILRGLMALMIMVYHYASWSISGYWGQRFVIIFGVYGVAIFYVLSGLTLYLVYNDRLRFGMLRQYVIKRILRIFPLLWLAILLTVFVLDRGHSLKTVLLNLSGLFGFVDYDNYIAIGSWSIGNELVFYSIFPLVLWFGKRVRFGLELCFLLAVLLGGYYAFGRISPEDTLHNQWWIYVHPFNHLFLFVGGMLLGKYGHYFKGEVVGWGLIGASFLFFVLYPLPDRVSLATGFTRVLYAGMSFFLTLGFYMVKVQLSSWPLKALNALGKMSYSVYLLHPIVFFFGAFLVNRRLYPLSYMLISMLATLLVSWLVYSQFEKRFIRLGKKRS